jgi:NDP-sugar pyrophosphorylase family protein
MTRRVSKAFVLGAGLGTRLRPLTTVAPKPLIPIFGKPLITFAFDHLIAAGIEHFVVNTHHLATQFNERFSAGSYRGCRVDLVHEPELLETAGGIKNAESLFGTEAFILYSGDVLTDVSLTKLLEAHWRSGNAVTLGLRQTGLAQPIVFDPATGRVLDLAGRLSTGLTGTLDFANISVWSPQVFRRIPPQTKISIVPVLADWIREGGQVGGALLEEGQWFNIGSITEYFEVHRFVNANDWHPSYLNVWPPRLAADVEIGGGLVLDGFSWVGSGARIGRDVHLRDSVIWPQTKVTAGARLQCSIVAGSCLEAGYHQDRIFL